MTRDKLVERIAQVTVSKGVARAVLDELDRAGLCIVPREPTEGMNEAGVNAQSGDLPVHEARAVYRAMIAAAGEG